MHRPPHIPGSYLVVELANVCSLACVHCSVSEADHPHHQANGYLDPALFGALIDDLVEVGARFDSLVMFWLGEPLLHPHFASMYRRALRAAVAHQVFAKIEVHTNATHLTAELTRALLNDAPIPQVLHFSLDAATRATYTPIKGMDRFDQVVPHVEAFLAAKGAAGARWPRPVMQFIVGKNNVAEVGLFRQHWSSACRQAGLDVRAAAGHVPPGEDAIVFYRQLDCPTPAQQEEENQVFREAMVVQELALPVEAAKGHEVKAQNLRPCSGFWKSPVVGWQGLVTVCTRDNRFENAVGSLAEARFSELWWGASMAGRRARVAGGDYTGLAPCATCFIPRSLNHAELADDDIVRTADHQAQGAA
jgi:hypothetical protein